MKLNTISEGTWNIISSYLNYNFNKLSIATSKLKEIKLVSFKGTYMSEAELINSQSSPIPGDYAFVLSTSGSDVVFSVYYSDLNYSWVTDGGVYDPDTIVANYIEMIELSNISQIDKDIEDYNRHKT